MPEFSIRSYQKSDELHWLDVHASVMVDSPAWWSVLHQKPQYKNDAIELVAVDDAKIVGFIDIEMNAKIDEKDHPAGFVWEFGVHRDFRSQGIGKKLIEQAHNLMKEKFRIDKSIWYSQDETAQKYYEQIGMKQIDEHWQFSIVASKDLFKQLLKKGFNCWNLRGSCRVANWEKVRSNFTIIEKDETLKPRLCRGYEYIK